MLCVFVAIIIPAVCAQGNPPRLVPYTITTVAGGAIAPTQGTTGFSGGTVCGAPWPADHTGLGPTWPTPPFDFLGDGCLATQAYLNQARYGDPDPFGTLWIVDTYNGASAPVRVVNPLTGIITYPFAPFGTLYDSNPRGGGFDISGNYYFMGENKSKGWEINYISGEISQFSGATSGGSSCGGGNNVTEPGGALDNPSTVVVDVRGNTYLVNNKCFRVQRIDASQTMWFVLGTGAAPTVLPCPVNATAGTTGLNTPYAVAVDPAGNLYVANQTCYTLLEVLLDPTTANLPGGPYVTANSQVVVIAGNGTAVTGYTYTQLCYGNEPCGLATSTPVEPQGVQLDPEGPVSDSNGNLGYNLYIQEGSHVWYYDFATKWLRRIAGGNANCSWDLVSPPVTPPTPFSIGDTCPATNSYLTGAYGIDVDALGNVYVGDAADVQYYGGADTGSKSSLIRKIWKGTQLTDGSALSLNAPFIPQYSPNGTPVPLQGTVTAQVHYGPGDRIAASDPFQTFGTNFTLPTNVTDVTETSQLSPDCAQNAADTSWDCLFSINFTASGAGTATAPLTVAGTAAHSLTEYELAGTVNEPAIAVDPGVVSALSTSVNNPGGIAADAAGNWYVADTGNNQILKNGEVLVSGLKSPQGIAIDGVGNVYFSDTGNNEVKVWTALTGTVTTVAGGGTPCTTNSWTFQADAIGNNCLATQATLNQPTALAVDTMKNLYILDSGNAEVRRVDPKQKTITLVAGGGGTGISACSGNPAHPRCSTLETPIALAVGAPGLVYVVEGGSTNDIAYINLLTFPATMTKLHVADDHSSKLNGVAVDAAGNVYYSDAGFETVGMANAFNGAYLPSLNPNAVDQLVLGVAQVPGDTAMAPGNLADKVSLNGPGALAVDPAGNVYVADVNNLRILKVDRSQTTVQFDGVVNGAWVPAPAVTATNVGTQPLVLQPLLFVGAFANDFSLGQATGIQGDCSTAALASGASCEIQVQAQAQPSDKGAISAQLPLLGNAINAPAIQINATAGTITPTTTALSFNPALTFSGEATQWVAQVTPSSCSGAVTFSVDGEPFTTASIDNSEGTFQGTYHTPFLWKSGKDPFLQTCGLMSLEAHYSDPSGVCADSASTQSILLPGAPTTTSVTAAGGTSNGTVLTIAQYQTLTLTANILSQVVGSPTGTVEYRLSGTTSAGQLVSTVLVPQEGSSPTPAPSTANLNGTGTSTFATQWLPPGTYQIYAKYLGDCNFNPSDSSAAPITVKVTQVPWDFSMVVGSTTATQTGAQGSQGQVVLNLTPMNYPGAFSATGTTTINFTCAGVPVFAACTFSFNPLTLNSIWADSTSAAYFHCPNYPDKPCGVTMYLITNLPPIATNTAPKGYRRGLPALAALALMCPGLVLVGAGLRGELRSRKGLRRKLLLLVGLMLLLGVLLNLPGCGGSFTKVNAITPAGSYPITITATMVGQNGTSVVHTLTTNMVVSAQ